MRYSNTNDVQDLKRNNKKVEPLICRIKEQVICRI